MARPQNASLDTELEFFNLDLDNVMNAQYTCPQNLHWWSVWEILKTSHQWSVKILTYWQLASQFQLLLVISYSVIKFFNCKSSSRPFIKGEVASTHFPKKCVFISVLLSELRNSTGGHRTDSRFYYSGKPQKLWPNVVTFTRSVFYWIFGWLWFWDCGIGDHLALLSPWQNGKDFLYLTGIFCRLGFYDNITQQYNSLWLGIELTKMSSHFN